MKASDLLKYLPSPDANATGHGLDLINACQAYKYDPHFDNAVYLKYLVHRLENGKKYQSASPEEQEAMDRSFLKHHVFWENGIGIEKLKQFIQNPDTVKLAKQLVNHKQKLNNFILKEHPEHIVNINGEPHLRLTRGLDVDRKQRGEERALASYADQPDPPFGGIHHHQFVPLKNIWYTYDYGPKEASLNETQNEFLVSPHKVVYNDTAEPTKQVLVREHHKLTTGNNIRFWSFRNKKLSLKDIDENIEKDAGAVAYYLKDHPLLNAQHINKIIEKDPSAALKYLQNHKDFNANHISQIIEKNAGAAAEHLKNHKDFNANHISQIIEKDPYGWGAGIFKDHSLLNANHISQIIEKNAGAAAAFFKDHPLLNEDHISQIIEKNAGAAAEHLQNHKDFNANHISQIIEKNPWSAARFLVDHEDFNANHIGQSIEKMMDTKDPLIKLRAVAHFKDHPLLNANHISQIIEKDPFTAAGHLQNHPLLNEQHIDRIVETAHSVAAQFLSNHPIYKAKYGNMQKSFKQLTKEYERLTKAGKPTAASLLKYLPSPDANATGHGLDLTKVYRSYKNSPHNPEALYLKYLVHRLENGEKYQSASPLRQRGMDISFLIHHQRGKAAEKNGRINADDLKKFIENPDTIKLAKQLINHKQKLNNFILKEHPDHIVDINGEPHLRLTRGLKVNREQRGEEHALASYADQPDPPFGGENPTYHHQHVPLKNIWFTFDYGPKEASSEKFGPENEFLVSPHKIIYNENHEDEPTTQILARKHHKLKATNHLAFASTRDKLSLQDIDTIVQDSPAQAAKYLKNHPLFNQSHVDKISINAPETAAKHLKKRLTSENIDSILHSKQPSAVTFDNLKNHTLLNKNHISALIRKSSWLAARFLHNHPSLDKTHVDAIVADNPHGAARYLYNHPAINAKHIQYMATEYPDGTAEYFADHPLLNKEHIDTIMKESDVPIGAAGYLANHPSFNSEHLNIAVKDNPEEAAAAFNEHPLLNEQHIDQIVEKNPEAAAAYLKNHPIYKAKYGNMQKSFKQLTKEYERLTKAGTPVKINPEHGRMIADAYHDMKHDPNHPEVKAAYNALINETNEQYKNLLQQGYKFTRITDPNFQPYKNSKEMHADIENNKHLYYYPTSLGFGSEDSHPKDHPLLTPTEFVSHDGEQMVANDILRQVHDINGHFLGGKTSFGPVGEHQSYLQHKKMYSNLAGKALATETMGQNSYVNFSSQIGHLNREKPGSAYAPQKAGLMPNDVINKEWHT